MIKSFRKKRLSGSSDQGKHNISKLGSSSFNDSSVVLQTPKIVIKALYDYRPQGPDELGFRKGDFFHVMHDNGENRENESNGWYEATNPMSNAKGMVPMSYFEVFNRSRPKTEDYHPNANGGVGGPKFATASPPQLRQSSSSQRNSNQTLYAVTLYQFKAERDDELDITPGENLIICAHHEFEWFIAKPINRLGGPGLVPALYVKIVDLINPANSTTETDVVKIINNFKIPTVEQWKNQTAKYQASTIPLGSISNQTPPISSNTQYFQKDANYSSSNRSSLSSSNTSIIEAVVDSYQLENGRYQYLIIARLTNGKVRYLYRYYQDFYDLQVKLLELYPYEAGKIENSKRIIPSIPGPLINVNDSISKLRREKLDYYLRNLIALPLHISKSEEVLKLFDILDNGFDKEVSDSNYKQRQLKPISQKSNYLQDRLSQYSNVHNNQQSTTPTSSESNLNGRLSSSSTNLINNYEQQSQSSSQPSQPSQQSQPPQQQLMVSQVLEPETHTQPQQPQPPISKSQGTDTEDADTPTSSVPPENPSNSSQPTKKVKVKFYYKDDIFVLLLPSSLRLQDLKSKLLKRLNMNEPTDVIPESIRIFLKNDIDDFQQENNISDINFNNDIHELKLKEFEVDDDEKFHSVLYDKCKLCILA